MTCDRARTILTVWCAADDLPDPMVAHIERCPGCAAAFDARFPPLVLQERSIPAVHSGRHSTRIWRVAVAVAIAAALPLAWQPHAAQPFDAPGSMSWVAVDECPVFAELPPECPPA